MKKQAKCLSMFTVTLLAVMFLMSGCTATTPLPPVKPIKDFKDVAGIWKIEDAGRTLSINADGTYIAQGGGPRGDRFEITGGKMKSSAGTTFSLHEGEGKRVLVGVSRRGTERVWKEAK